jgi:hypothetical protein
MSIENKFESLTIESGADYRTVGQHKAVVVAGTIAATAAAIGLIKSKPADNENLRVGYKGIMKFLAGGAITAGVNMTVTTSGFIVSQGSADGATVGKCLVTASSGDLGLGVFDFTTAGPLT